MSANLFPMELAWQTSCWHRSYPQRKNIEPDFSTGQCRRFKRSADEVLLYDVSTGRGVNERRVADRMS